MLACGAGCFACSSFLRCNASFQAGIAPVVAASAKSCEVLVFCDGFGCAVTVFLADARDGSSLASLMATSVDCFEAATDALVVADLGDAEVALVACDAMTCLGLATTGENAEVAEILKPLTLV